MNIFCNVIYICTKKLNIFCINDYYSITIFMFFFMLSGIILINYYLIKNKKNRKLALI